MGAAGGPGVAAMECGTVVGGVSFWGVLKDNQSKPDIPESDGAGELGGNM